MSDLVCRIARSAGERAGYFELRRSIFCDEQGIFAGSDRDELDAAAHPIVCLDGERVVGVVRIWEDGPGLWWGGRLGVHRDFRPSAAWGAGWCRPRWARREHGGRGASTPQCSARMWPSSGGSTGARWRSWRCTGAPTT